MRNLHAVVFDLDGLLVNTEELYEHVGGEMLRRRGKILSGDLLTAMMGRPQRIALQLMIDHHQLPDTVSLLAAETTEIFESLLATRLLPMPGALSLLEALEFAQIPKAIATSSHRHFAENVLGRLGWLARFSFLVCGDEVTHGKPDPEIYQRAAEKMGCSPSEIMVLEDSQNGCLAAIASGAFTVAVPAGHSHTHNFSGAQLIADTLADVRIYDALAIRPRDSSTS